ncbi:MAG TPA: class I SAM-dependent methyltransferase [Solirubrobacteraceae bacterium]|nr:class I SAM-dependent methyltransferase [Solirubrobacteraceae bacterium]
MKPASALQKSCARAARDPDAWEQGCATDKVRNEVVIPHLADVLCSLRARSVLDLGSGTGYITRVLAQAPWATGISWTLVDIDEQLLRYALASMSSSLAAERTSR